MGNYANSKILLIDNTVEKLKSNEKLLNNEGYKTIVTESGYDAIDIMLSEKVDLVLFSLAKKDEREYEIIKIIKSNIELNSIPIIIIYENENNFTKCLEAGADECLLSTAGEQEKLIRIYSMLKLYHKNEELKNIKIDLQSLNTQIEYLSERDSLTGIYNKRYFETRASEVWRKSSREKRSFSILLIDIDHFKIYNDFYGYEKGDECLKKIAILIQENLKRPGDFAARFSGEEFVIVLPETDEKGAVFLAEKIRKAVIQMKIENKSNEGIVTVSIGAFATTANFILTLDIFLNNAKEALYISKKNGRNKVSVLENF